jgi:8-amino-7-oxononanoate synthase
LDVRLDVHESKQNAAQLLMQRDTAFGRALIISGLRIKFLVGDTVARLRGGWRRWRRRNTDGENFARSESFAGMASYTSIIKHRAVAERFSFTDPFYRCHDESMGAEISIDGRRFLSFASYDYLGLNRHPIVAQAAKAAIEQYGTSVSASRIVAGERPLHRELETALAELYGTESALTFVSGHATNISTIGTLTSADDLILYDELAHNSILVGAKLSGATAFGFRHNNLDSLERLLRKERSRHKNTLIVVEGLYSMDGDIPDLPRLIALKEHYGAWLMIDEAHALGVLGRRGKGIAEHFGIAPGRVDIWMGTLSKALAGCGGYIAGSRELVEILKFHAPGQVYSVGMSPPVAAAALASLALLKAEPERVARLQANGELFLKEAKSWGLDTVTSEGYAVVPIMVGDIVKAGRLTDRLLARGVNVLPIIYPAVPLKAARLRFFVTSSHTPEQIRSAVEITANELRLVGGNVPDLRLEPGASIAA